MVYVRKPKTATSAIKLPQPQAQIKPVAVDPLLQRQRQRVREIQAFTARPTQAQKQLVRPAFTALQLQREEHSRVEGVRPALRSQISELTGTIPPNAIRDALQREQERDAPLPRLQHPQTQSDWVTVMRQQAIQAEGRRMDSREVMQFTALQRQVAQRLVQGFRTDRQPAAERYAEYADHLVSLQRHPISGHVASAVMTMIPQGERPALQRAVDEVLQREAVQRQQDEIALNLHTLQRQLAELDEQATQPVFERIQARKGAGNPLPEAVQRHLEQGLNHDLSGVRIHDDAEADKLSKGVNAIAFTTGNDIFFQSGKFNPNTQTGMELLAHEVTHTVQQSKGKVGKGIDPSASHETEAQDMGRKLAIMPSPKSLIPPVPHKEGPYAPGIYNQKAATQRIQSGAANHALLNPLRALQRQPDLTIQRSFIGDKLSELAGQIPGYKPLTLALGYDPVAGKTIPANPNALLDALGNFVPGPFKDMVKVIREQKLVDKAWTWFKAELSKLQLSKVITDIKGALSGLPNISKAKNILTTAANKVRNLVTGSARKLAEIAITAITAGLSPVGKRIMTSLAQAGDIITQVLKNPGQFAKNLMNAMKQGFTGFVTRSATWLQKGLGDFLTGSANIQMPKNLNVEGVLMTALSIMDLTYDALRGRLVKELGPGAEKKIAFLETAGGALGQLKGSVGKAPEMKGIAGKVGGEVLGGIKTELTETLVKKGIAKVALMFNPAGAAIGAIMAAWSTIQTVIDKGKQIMGVIMNALSSIREIAAGNVAGAANFIEQTVGKALPVVFSFAANFLGLGNIGTRIRNLVKAMRQKLGIDKFINGIIARLKKLVGAGKQVAGKGHDESKDTPQSLKVKRKVEQYLQSTLPAKFEAPSEIRSPALKAANKFRQEGLKYLTINRSKGIFEVSAVASPAKKVAKSKAVMRITKRDFEAAAQSAKKVGLSKEEMRFTKSDISGFGFGGVTLYASINGVAIDKKFGPIAGVHAETLLINYINNNAEKLLKKGRINHISIQLSSSPCGEDPQDDKCKNCAGNLRTWAQSKGHTISITFLSLYKGEKNAATTSALKELSESDRVISLEAWDEASVESQIRAKFGGNPPEKVLSGLKRKAAAAKKKLEEISGEKL